MLSKRDNESKIVDYLRTDSVNPLLTDFYQFSMIYAHWKNGRTKENAVFDLYFRKCPFNLNFCVFGGVDECFEFLRNFKFTEDHIKYLRTQFPQAEEEFFIYLSSMDMTDIKIYGFTNSEFVLPNEPLFTLEGSLDKIQLIESTLLNLTNYPTLISSLALKIRQSSNLGLMNKLLIEDGSIYAQSPNGAVMGIKYSIVGGVDKTTNLLASKLFNLPLFGVTPIIDDDMHILLQDDDFILDGQNMFEIIKSKASEEEYNKIKSKILIIIYSVIITYKSGSFAFEIKSKENLEEEILMFSLCVYAIRVIKKENNNNFKNILILKYPESIYHVEQVYSKFSRNNLINVKDILLFIKYNPLMLKENFSDKINFFDGIILGPDFLVSYTQPALGMVYKINQINGNPCMKFSEEKGKQTIPGFKTIIRMFDNGFPLGDFMCLREETDDYINKKEIIAYLFNEFKNKIILKFDSLKIMNNLIFSDGREQSEHLDTLEMREKVLENNQLYLNKDLKLYISEGIKKIIVNEINKLEDISA